MSSVISKKPLTEYGTQPYGPRISANPVCTIGQLYDKATSPVQMNGSIGERFRTTVGVRQGCLLSPTLFNDKGKRAFKYHGTVVSDDASNQLLLR